MSIKSAAGNFNAGVVKGGVDEMFLFISVRGFLDDSLIFVVFSISVPVVAFCCLEDLVVFTVFVIGFVLSVGFVVVAGFVVAVGFVVLVTLVAFRLVVGFSVVTTLPSEPLSCDFFAPKDSTEIR